MNVKECREIYREAFKDPDTSFEDLLFGLCGQYCRFEMCGDKTAAILFALPCRIMCGEKSTDAFYVFAAATKREYRKMGYMSRLIKRLEAEGVPIFLKPADAGLVKFYEKLGFTPFTARRTEPAGCSALPEGGFKELCRKFRDADTGSYTAMYFGPDNLKPDNMYFPYTME